MGETDSKEGDHLKKRIMQGLLIAAVMLLLAACGANDPEAKRYAMLTGAGGTGDNALTEQVWTGLSAAAAEKPCVATAYAPEEDTEEAFKAQFKALKKDGAKLVFCAGESMRDTLTAGQKANKKLHFVLIEDDTSASARKAALSKEDAKEEEIYKNTAYAVIAPQDAGYLIGYALVTNGNTRLGFMGGDQKIDTPYACGLIQGAERAASDKALAAGTVTVRIAFTGDAQVSPAKMDTAMQWYDDGTEVIYAPQKGVRKSVIAAAELTENGRVAASGTEDASSESSRVLMTAKMDYDAVVRKIASDFENDAFAGGERTTYGVLDSCVSLAADYSSLTGFSDTNYSLLLSNLSSGQARIGRTEQITSQIISINME